MVNQYDAVLTAVPGTLIGGIAGLPLLAGASLETATIASAALAALLVGYALFAIPPCAGSDVR
ncbi:hypothetical protein RYH80_18225 [Halobaculum sp. MBLA0147]|uniref:hypothetical protein n=1 Tax=Halobaculum sp. MBLA0147 TaxID=3079934 RepID=UPI0035250D4B